MMGLPRIENEIARRGIKLVGGVDRCGPCPVCGGRDRFAINVMKQVFNCRGCGRGGDVIDLIRLLDGVGYKQALAILAGGGVRHAPILKPAVKPADDDKERIALAMSIWGDAGPIRNTLAEVYLLRRGLEPPEEDHALRFHPSCPFVRGVEPCVVALFRDIKTNEPRAIQRTALRAGGFKANRFADPRMSLGPTSGCAVKLTLDEDVEYGLHVSEGVETALAGMQRGLRPAWALGGRGTLKTFPVLPGIEALTIMVDNDHADQKGRRAGPEAAVECAKHWHAAGREVWWDATWQL
jgi:hypothetical protein